MLVKHIDRNAKITTDKWKGYGPLASDYDIPQLDFDKEVNFKDLSPKLY